MKISNDYEWIWRGEPKGILCYYDMMIRISSSMLVYLKLDNQS